MNKIRLPILIIVVSLTLTSIIALQALAISSENTSNRAGMGDLKRFEAQQVLINTGNTASSRVGIGDLKRFEAQQALANTTNYVNTRVGMGNLQRFEAQQTIVNAGMSIPGTSNRVCPNLSTSYGEKDAGASAPAYVLQAKGCMEQAVK